MIPFISLSLKWKSNLTGDQRDRTQHHYSAQVTGSFDINQSTELNEDAARTTTNQLPNKKQQPHNCIFKSCGRGVKGVLGAKIS